MSVQVTQGAAEAFFLLAIGVGLLVLQISTTVLYRRKASKYPNYRETQLPRLYKYGFGAAWSTSVIGLLGAYYIACNHWGGRSVGVGIPSIIALISTGATFITIMVVMAFSAIDSDAEPEVQK